MKVVIDKTLADLKLEPGKYVSAHFRSRDHFFHNDEINEAGLVKPQKVDLKYVDMIENSLACAFQISPNKSFPIYFTSSNMENVKHALTESEFVKKQKCISYWYYQCTTIT